MSLVDMFRQEKGRWPRGNVQDEVRAWAEDKVKEAGRLRASLAEMQRLEAEHRMAQTHYGITSPEAYQARDRLRHSGYNALLVLEGRL